MPMPQERMEHAILMLTGQVHALSLAVQALAKSHPQPTALQGHLNQAEQQGLASLENLPVRTDTVIEGYQSVMAAVQKALASSVEGLG